MNFTVNGLHWHMSYANADLAELNPDDNAYLGLTKYISQTILIRSDLSHELTRRTVIHELVHCFLFSFGMQTDKYDEEQLCNFVEAHMDAILDITNHFFD